MKFARAAFVLAILLAGSGTAVADPCPGAPAFTDVSASANYCTETEWLKNRQISLGCIGTNYCPNDLVARSSMALFMKRLGVALTPVILQVDEAPGAVDLDVTTVVCQTPDYNTGTFPRTGVAHMTFTGLTAGSAALRADLVYSTNGGASWALMSPGNWWNRTGDVTSGIWLSTSQSLSHDFATATTVRFGVQLVRSNLNGGTGDLTDSRCFMHAQIINRNSATSPYDGFPAGNLIYEGF